VAAFEYVAVDGGGRQTRGIVEGDSLRQVRQSLRDKGLVPLSVDPAAQKSREGQPRGFLLSAGPGINVRDLSLVTRQMSTLVAAGLPLEEVLTAVSQQTEKPRVRSILMAVRSKVMEGFSLADGLGEFPKAFPKLYRATIAAGEHSGHLDLVMSRLADYTESSHETRRNIRNAMIYPALLLVIAISIVAFLMVSVVPGIIEVFEDNGQPLPGITIALVAVSNFFANYLLHMIIGVAAIFSAVKFLLSKEPIRIKVHKKILQLPVLGKLSRTLNTARFASTVSILTSSGVALVDAMKIAGEVLSNEWLKIRVGEATRSVSEGASLKNALEQAGYFPPMMLHMIASGEASGELDAMLDKTAKAQEMDLDNFIKVTVSLLPPLIIIVMALLVFTIVIAILLPIIQLNQLVI
jgi:general secretion pathway protein F